MALVGAQEVLPDCRTSQRKPARARRQVIASGSYDNGSYMAGTVQLADSCLAAWRETREKGAGAHHPPMPLFLRLYF
jgi:hypothetical protein